MGRLITRQSLPGKRADEALGEVIFPFLAYSPAEGDIARRISHLAYDSAAYPFRTCYAKIKDLCGNSSVRAKKRERRWRIFA